MKARKDFPFTAYTLTAGMNVKQVEVIGEHWWSGYADSRAGLTYKWSDLHPTPQEAIAAGHAKLDEQRAKLQKQQANLEKRAANLEKSAAGL